MTWGWRTSGETTWTIIGVADVATGFNWYHSLLGSPPSTPAHTDFGQILDADGTVLLCLHAWGAHEHPTLTSPEGDMPAEFSLRDPDGYYVTISALDG